MASAHTVDFTTTIGPADEVKAGFSSQESRTIDAGSQPRTHGFKAEVPLRDLVPGKYVLRVEATSRLDERSVAKEIPFQITEAPRSTTF